MYVQDTIVAPATAPGAGAVAIVRLSGPRAIEIAKSFWHRATNSTLTLSLSREKAGEGTRDAGERLEPRRMYLGEVINPATGAAIDRAMCVIMPAPHSFTGEDVAELHCHGGPYIVRRVVALTMALGARMADAGEFSRRAFLNGRIDLTEAEAISDLIGARSESSLVQALAQLQGALASRVEGLRQQVIAIRAHLEAEIDFSDEDIALPSRMQIGADLERLSGDIRVLHDSFARGRLMREGARAAIVGKPNAGKSSIMNLLLGIERAIVTAIPGTTRDVIEDTIQLGPYQLVLQDTAGVREARDEVERIGVARTLSHAADADLLIAIFDSSRPFEREDAEVLRVCHARPGLAILNKRDLPQRLTLEDLRGRGLAMPVVTFSAIRAEGVEALRDELKRAIEAMAAEGRAGDGVAISRERHRQALATALEALMTARSAAAAAMPPEIVAVDVALAADALGAITGAVTSEDVLDAVFREFCIGK